MKTMTLVLRTNDQEQLWTRVDKNDLVKSFVNDSLRIVSNDIVKKYNIKDGDRKDKFEGNNEFEDDLSNCDLAETFLGDHIRIDSINEDDIYFDNYTDEFFKGDDVLGWESNDYYWYHDGSNYKMDEISEIKEIEAEEINFVNLDTGREEEFKCEKGIFKIAISFYQGSHDTVIEEHTNIIDMI